jgi:uncharacterized protein YcbX
MNGMSVAGLWRYPVKSMAGEAMTEGAVSTAGLEGDRAFALVDAAGGKSRMPDRKDRPNNTVLEGKS